jgi:hypothetical protein
MANDPLGDYLATLRAATGPGTPELNRDDPMMDAIAEAIDDIQWRDISTED